VDGGGVRGIMANEIMSQICLRTHMHPNQMFDLICGSSTGGILSCLYGLIGMPIEQCRYGVSPIFSQILPLTSSFLLPPIPVPFSFLNMSAVKFTCHFHLKFFVNQNQPKSLAENCIHSYTTNHLTRQNGWQRFGYLYFNFPQKMNLKNKEKMLSNFPSFLF
jgi:hypothetical protein